MIQIEKLLLCALVWNSQYVHVCEYAWPFQMQFTLFHLFEWLFVCLFVVLFRLKKESLLLNATYSAFWYDDGESLLLESPWQSTIKFSPLPLVVDGERDLFRMPSGWSSDPRDVELKLLELQSSPSMCCEWTPGFVCFDLICLWRTHTIEIKMNKRGKYD